MAEWKRANRGDTELSVILCDIDFFKAYNDSLGHVAGDECLISVATKLKEFAPRDFDLVARYGGEEFAVVLPAIDLEAAIAVASRMRSGVEGLRIPHPASQVADVVTISLGVATVKGPSHRPNPRWLVRQADIALYRAKLKGRNQLVSAPDGVGESTLVGDAEGLRPR